MDPALQTALEWLMRRAQYKTISTDPELTAGIEACQLYLELHARHAYVAALVSEWAVSPAIEWLQQWELRAREERDKMGQRFLTLAAPPAGAA